MIFLIIPKVSAKIEAVVAIFYVLEGIIRKQKAKPPSLLALTSLKRLANPKTIFPQKSRLIPIKRGIIPYLKEYNGLKLFSVHISSFNSQNFSKSD